MTRTIYEWDLETVDEHGDIIDHCHADKLAELEGWTQCLPGEYVRLVLVRDTWTPINPAESIFGMNETLENRHWAYVTAEGLPARTNEGNGHKVPKRYQAEFARNKWAAGLIDRDEPTQDSATIDPAKGNTMNRLDWQNLAITSLPPANE
tara:strand:- start:2629 stop:3078 length:450 start_codon:yes stop_codon:yes gene_type:complete